MDEIEIKILEVDPKSIAKTMRDLGAVELQDAKLSVNWFRRPGLAETEDEWFLRIRSSSSGKTEVTWKSRSRQVGSVKLAREITVELADAAAMAQLFEAIGLQRYAFQEKHRRSWRYQDWRFDLDQYPGMPPYLEIEGYDEEHIHKAVLLLSLQRHKTSAEGERTLIQKQYGLDWFDMRF